ncbi:MAG: gamma-glutamyltransferase [Dehalococcoidia bacterium]|nr:gamma-glutamyltransferase [Dehalococcoidia bacterium]
MTTSAPTITTINKTEARSTGGMVATKDIHATKAGVQMLEMGGNAVDAAVAACFAIGVVEPWSCGIGGGGYMVYQLGDQGGVIGFPMKGPLDATPDMYEFTGEKAVGNFGWPGVVNNENLEGFRSIAAPGAVAGLCEANLRLGKLPLSEVVAPAVSLARDGYSPGWHNIYSLSMMSDKLFKYDELRSVFMPGGSLPTGDLTSQANLKQPDLADVLEAIGREGASAFYSGDIAEALTSDIRANGGILSMRDLAEYKPFVWDGGLEFGYSGHTVRVPPFQCAGTTSAMTLKLLDGFDIEAMGHNSPEALHAYIYAARLAYVDRFRYMADPAFVDVPWAGLVSDGYTENRRALIDSERLGKIESGDPWAFEEGSPSRVFEASAPALDSGTTHLCAMDVDGGAVSLTNTLMAGFGSGIIPKGTGVVMNNGMMWFDPVPGRVNSIMPGKYPLNNMTPALVMDSDGVKLAVGASGGRRITNCVTQLITKVVNYGMGPQEAIDSPRLDCSLPVTSVDPRLPAEVVAELESRGHHIYTIGDGHVEGGFASFASPVAIIRDPASGFRAGVDTFHSAYAAGP